MRNLFAILGLSLTALSAACSSGSHPKTNAIPDGSGISTGDTSGIAALADNVTEISVDNGGPSVNGYINGLFASVTVCVPGTSQCQTIDHVLVGTGAVGLRLLGSVLTLPLPAWTDPNGTPLAECGQFIAGSTWGPLQSADFSIANEQAANLPIQVIGESTYPKPASCTGTDISTPDAFGANGLLGVGSFLQDCGAACAAPIGAGSTNPGAYYACSSTAIGGCQAEAVPVSKQVSNPVSLFSQDNNGIIIELPAVPADGAPSVTGALVFGIGTRDNNGLGQATVLPLDSTTGNFLTKYPANGTTWQAFADTGSNAFYFLDSATTGIPTCPGSLSSLYCPTSTLSLSATIQDATGLVSVNVDFSIANAEALSASPGNVAFGNLGGPLVVPSSTGTGTGGYFLWGMPFYFGRKVFTSIEGQSTPVGTEPFIAFGGATFGTESTGGSSGTGGISADASSAPDASEPENFCTGPATGAVIDDMSGPNISLQPPSCGSPGGWTASSPAPGVLTTPAGDPSIVSNCGSLCESLYSPLPAGFPGSTASLDAGAVDSGTVDGGTSSLQAMCMVGQTGSRQYAWSGMTLAFAYSGTGTSGNGPAMLLSASGFTTDPPPALIDASQYSGIEFWLWASPDTAAALSSAFVVQLVDKNQLPGGGVCNPNVASGTTSCANGSAAISFSTVATTGDTGSLLGGDGSELTSLAPGWQLVQAPWNNFVVDPYYGGGNEKSLDPTTLAFAQFAVMQDSASGAAIPFDFCVYGLKFYK